MKFKEGDFVVYKDDVAREVHQLTGFSKNEIRMLGKNIIYGYQVCTPLSWIRLATEEEIANSIAKRMLK